MSAKLVITQEQSCNTNAIYKQCIHTFKNLFVLTFCDVFSSGILVREALLNFSKTTNCTCPTGSFNFVVLEKFTCTY